MYHTAKSCSTAGKEKQTAIHIFMLKLLKPSEFSIKVVLSNTPGLTEKNLQATTGVCTCTSVWHHRFGLAGGSSATWSHIQMEPSSAASRKHHIPKMTFCCFSLQLFHYFLNAGPHPDFWAKQTLIWLFSWERWIRLQHTNVLLTSLCKMKTLVFMISPSSSTSSVCMSSPNVCTFPTRRFFFTFWQHTNYTTKSWKAVNIDTKTGSLTHTHTHECTHALTHARTNTHTHAIKCAAFQILWLSTDAFHRSIGFQQHWVSAGKTKSTAGSLQRCNQYMTCEIRHIGQLLCAWDEYSPHGPNAHSKFWR